MRTESILFIDKIGLLLGVGVASVQYGRGAHPEAPGAIRVIGASATREYWQTLRLEAKEGQIQLHQSSTP
jgi:ATP-dependent Clp protease ATP-binding subunit ClpA